MNASIHSLKLKLCMSPPLLREVFALRYVSYRENNFIPENDDGLFIDQYDAYPCSLNFGVFRGDQLFGCIRACVANRSRGWYKLPISHAFPEVYERWRDQHEVVIEWGRFAISPLHKKHAKAITTTLFGSIPFLANYFNRPAFLCTVREEHIRYYSAFGYECIAPPARAYGVSYKTALLAMLWQSNVQRLREHRVFSRCFLMRPDLGELCRHDLGAFVSRYEGYDHD